MMFAYNWEYTHRIEKKNITKQNMKKICRCAFLLSELAL